MNYSTMSCVAQAGNFVIIRLATRRYYMGLIADQRGFGLIISGANMKRPYIALNKGLYEFTLKVIGI